MRIVISCEPSEVQDIMAALGELASGTCTTNSEDRLDVRAADILVLSVQSTHDSPTLEKIHRIRGRGQHFPILVIGSLWRHECAVRALDAGADDCLIGDDWRLEIRARVCALVRRSSGLWIPAGDARLHLNRECLAVHIQGREVPLTPTQYAILEYLVRHRDRWRSPELIIREVLGTCHQKGSSLVRFHVHNLRSALGDFGYCIHWQRGKGYMFNLESPISRRLATPSSSDAATIVHNQPSPKALTES